MSLQIVEKGALPHFVHMLETGDEDEKTAVCQCLWTLSFDKEVRQMIIDEAGCELKLQELTEHEDKELRRAARGAMWKLRGEAAHETSRETEKGSEEGKRHGEKD